MSTPTAHLELSASEQEARVKASRLRTQGLAALCLLRRSAAAPEDDPEEDGVMQRREGPGCHLPGELGAQAHFPQVVRARFPEGPGTGQTAVPVPQGLQ